MHRFITLCPILCALAIPAASQAEEARIAVLFLGDRGHHQPAERFKQLQPVLAARGIDLTYTEDTADLNLDTLEKYAGLIVYANIDSILAAEEASLLQYVAGGKGFIPLHCASYCFRNSKQYVELVGAQFQRHGTGIFRTTITDTEHPLMKGFRGFESFDETYVHTLHNEKNRVVLEVRKDTETAIGEPWTWVRTHGKGRVFYTAWGHDERTWGHPGFQNLVERGIRWAVGGDPGVVPTYSDRPEMTAISKDLEPFQYVEADVPFYPAGQNWGTLGEPLRQMQKPLSPDESIKHFVTPVGFQVELFAAEPDLQGKPLAMAWDERGRCWVCETVDYPNELQPEGQGRDRIRICEDTNHDGRADKFTVFADKLSIPTSLAFSRGGAIVMQPPHTLFLKDTDGDDVADVREILFTGWSTQDTHAGPSNLQYGFDNWLYGMVGYAGFEGTVGGEKHSFRQGFFRFKPDGSKIEFLRNTNNNSWGLGFSEEGILFGSTANGNPSVYMPIPNRYYEQVRGWSSSVLGSIAEDAHYEPITDKVREVDHHGSFTAAAGHALYTARAYPREYWNRTAFVCDPTGHLVSTFVITPHGADFRSKYAWNLLASDDEWSAPIMAEVGPDGHVWVIDWYNFIVQHNPTPAGFKTGKGNAYETDLRDKKHGRIYRVVWKDAKPVEPMTLKDAPPEKLVETLKNDNLLWRRHSQRLLVERGGDDAVDGLLSLAERHASNDRGADFGAVHAVWTLSGLNQLGRDDPYALVGSPAWKVLALLHRQQRAGTGSVPLRSALLAMTPSEKSSIDVFPFLADDSPQVRLAALLSMANNRVEPTETFADSLVSPRNLRDPALRDALTIAAARHATVALSTLCGTEHSDAADDMQIVAHRVAEHFARGRPRADDVETVLMAMPPAAASPPGIRGRTTETVIAALEKGWPKDHQIDLTSKAEGQLVQLVQSISPSARGALVSLAAKLGTKALEAYAAEIAASFLESATDEQQPEATRIVSAAKLIEFRTTDADTAASLLDLITPRTSPELARGLIEAVGKSEAGPVGATLLGRLRTLTPALRPTVFRVLLSRTEWTVALLDSLEAGDVQSADLTLDQKQSLAAHPDKTLATRAKTLLAKAGALPSADRQKVYEQLLHVAQKTGDAKAGKELFKKHCSKCHVHGSEGTRIGPDLTGMAVHPKAELLTNILDPSRSVEGNFRMYNLATVSGQVINGMLLSESKTAVELVDSEAKKHTVLREDIDELVASTKSLMPEGFEKLVTPAELTNLLEFLAQRGKYLPIPLHNAATVVSTKGMFFSEDADVERLIFPDWAPKTVDGVPFLLVDPRDGRNPNAILLHGPQGTLPPKMPKSVKLPCNSPGKVIHLLSGVSGWGFPYGAKGTVSMTVRLHYADGSTEDHDLINGEHFADYIRRVDVPKSKFAFALRGQQIRALSISPKKTETIREIEFVKGPDATAPVVMAVTVETDLP